MRKLLFFLVSLLLCASVALAQDVTELTQKADKGDVDAQYELGKLYFLGSPEVSPNREMAREWFVKALDGYGKRFQDGDLEAAYLLGIMYINGFGMDVDLAQGAQYIRLAAENGHEPAQLALANLILLGRGGVTKDYMEAFRMVAMAAERGYAPAYSKLGDMYMRGLGTDKDMVKALEYYAKAAEANDVTALYQLGERYAKGQYVGRDYAKAFGYWLKAAELGHPQSQNMAGVMLFQGLGVAKDLDRAYGSFLRASQNGELMACYNLGYALYHGYGTAQDYAKALPLFERLLATGRPQPQYMAGLMYANGQGTEQNHARAYELLELAASRKYLPAQYLLGKMYYNGDSLDVQDPVRAYIWLKAAEINAEAGMALSKEIAAGMWVSEEDPYLKTYADAKLLNDLQETIAPDRMAVAAYNLGIMYQRGIGFDINKVQALSWFLVGADYGHGSSTQSAERLEASVKPDELALAQKQAADWLKQYKK